MIDKKRCVFSKITFFWIFSLFLTGCGLPQYESIDKPIALSQNGNIISFQTPVADPSIMGYAIYYKIYDDSESTLIDSDKELFNPANYDSSQGESIPTGSTLLLSKNFFSMSMSGYNLFRTPLLDLKGGGGDTVEIDFTDQTSQPKLSVNSAQQMLLKRGSKGSDTSDDNDSGQAFFSFVNDYDYNNPDIDNDLTHMLSRVSSGSIGNNIQISVCVYTIGINLTTMTQMVSEPVFLGTLDYNSFSSTTHN